MPAEIAQHRICPAQELPPIECREHDQQCAAAEQHIYGLPRCSFISGKMKNQVEHRLELSARFQIFKIFLGPGPDSPALRPYSDAQLGLPMACILLQHPVRAGEAKMI